jgi:molybdate transport system substrate-binding protein
MTLAPQLWRSTGRQDLLPCREGLDTCVPFSGFATCIVWGEKVHRAIGRQIQMLRYTLSVLILGLWLFGCNTQGHREEQRLVMYAASSLTDVLGSLEKRFELMHPAIDVAIAYSGSQTLRLQIQQGAAADVFISANTEHMNVLADQGRIAQRQVFGYNRLALIVPKGNPAGIRNQAELDKARRLVIGTEQVPIGKYTRQWLLQMNEDVDGAFSKRVLSRVVSQENNVRLLRAKVELGEADAAIVYFTDAISSQRLEHVPIADETNIRTEYQLGIILKETSNVALSQWLGFLGSKEARELMMEEGLELQ